MRLVGGEAAMADLRLWFAAMAAVACQPALADGGKTVTGRCLAVIDGKTGQNGPCSIDLAVGGGFSFKTLNDDGVVRLVPDGTTHRGAASVTSQDGAPGKDATTALGTLKQDGACWTGARAKICAWDGKAEMLRNRAAPYTAFHTLLGKSIQARCQMGGCEWFRYDRATLVTHNDREAVLKIDGQEWTTSHPDYDYDRPRRRNDVTNGSFYFRCSHTRPAALWKSRRKGLDFEPLRARWRRRRLGRGAICLHTICGGLRRPRPRGRGRGRAIAGLRHGGRPG